MLTPEEEALFGPRVGLLLKQLGKVAQWVGPDDRDYSTWGVRMVVHKIEIDPKCDRYVDEPDRGHRLVLRAETSELYNSSRDGIPQYYEWSTIGPDSVSEASPSSLTCRSAAAFPDELRSSAKDCGNVTVETANPVGRAGVRRPRGLRLPRWALIQLTNRALRIDFGAGARFSFGQVAVNVRPALPSAVVRGSPVHEQPVAAVAVEPREVLARRLDDCAARPVRLARLIPGQGDLVAYAQFLAGHPSRVSAGGSPMACAPITTMCQPATLAGDVGDHDSSSW